MSETNNLFRPNLLSDFVGQDEIVTIAHEAQSKAVFAKGAVRAAIFIGQKKEAGLYNMKDLIASV